MKRAYVLILLLAFAITPSHAAKSYPKFANLTKITSVGSNSIMLSLAHDVHFNWGPAHPQLKTNGTWAGVAIQQVGFADGPHLRYLAIELNPSYTCAKTGGQAHGCLPDRSRFSSGTLDVMDGGTYRILVLTDPGKTVTMSLGMPRVEGTLAARATQPVSATVFKDVEYATGPSVNRTGRYTAAIRGWGILAHAEWVAGEGEPLTDVSGIAQGANSNRILHRECFDGFVYPAPQDPFVQCQVPAADQSIWSIGSITRPDVIVGSGFTSSVLNATAGTHEFDYRQVGLTVPGAQVGVFALFLSLPTK